MNWEQAVAAMRRGEVVRRFSQAYLKQKAPGFFETGEEGCRLAAAWTVDNTPVFVFQGADSQCLFIPESHHIEATDWVVVIKGVQA